MIDVCKTWDDFLWAYTKTILFFKVMHSYNETEQKYLEMYEFVYGDFYDTESSIKNEIVKWNFPNSCPSNFNEVFKVVKNKFEDHSLFFKNRPSNLFYDIMMSLLQIQISASITDDIQSKWAYLIEQIYDNLNIDEIENEEVIFLRF